MPLKTKQLRFFETEMRAVNTEEKEMIVEGYALKFDTETVINEWGYEYIEKIDRQALDNADLSNVILNFNHSFDSVMARTTNKSLVLIIDDIGLKIRATLADTSTSRDVYQLIKEGLINRMSWHAVILKSDWIERENQRDVRTIAAFGKFYDVSAVTFPAYEDTEISTRNKNIDEEVKRHFEGGKDKMAKEIKKEEVVEEVKEEEAEEVKEETKRSVDVNINVDTSAITRQKNDIEQLGGVGTNDVVERSKKSEDIYATRGYLEAWTQHVRDNSQEPIKRFVSTNDSGASTGGKVVIPTLLVNAIEHGVRDGGSIAALCNITNFAGLTSIPVEESASDADWKNEGVANPEGTITLGEVLLKPKYIQKWFRITDEMESMSISALADYLLQLIPDKILSLIDNSIIARPKTDNGINGITTNTDTKFNAVLDADLEVGVGFKANAFLDTGKEAGAVVVMNRKTFFQNVMQKRDTTGQPIYTMLNDAKNGAQFFFDGMRVVFSNALKSYDEATKGEAYMIVGDFSGYRLNFPNGYGVDLLRDPYTNATDGMIRYIGKIFVGGNIAKVHHFVTVKKVS